MQIAYEIIISLFNVPVLFLLQTSTPFYEIHFVICLCNVHSCILRFVVAKLVAVVTYIIIHQVGDDHYWIVRILFMLFVSLCYFAT